MPASNVEPERGRPEMKWRPLSIGQAPDRVLLKTRARSAGTARRRRRNNYSPFAIGRGAVAIRMRPQQRIIRRVPARDSAPTRRKVGRRFLSQKRRRQALLITD